MKQTITFVKNLVASSLLLVFILTMTFCQSDQDTLTQETKDTFNKSSRIATLMVQAVGSTKLQTAGFAAKSENNDDNDGQCTEFQYPISFFRTARP